MLGLEVDDLVCVGDEGEIVDFSKSSRGSDRTSAASDLFSVGEAMTLVSKIVLCGQSCAVRAR